MAEPSDPLLDPVDPGNPVPNKAPHHSLIGLPSIQDITFVPAADILYCKGESSQTSLYLASRKRVLVNRTLKHCEAKLEELGFCRIHKSYVVNLAHIRRYIRGEGRSIELSDGTRLEISPKHKDTVMRRMNLL